jgi:hypothetical protein
LRPFSKTIPVEGEPAGRAVIVAFEADCNSLIRIAFADRQSFEVLDAQEARAVAAVLIQAAKLAEIAG